MGKTPALTLYRRCHAYKVALLDYCPSSTRFPVRATERIPLFRFPLAGRLSVVAPSFVHYIRPGHLIVHALTIDFTFISGHFPSHPSPCSLIKPFDGTVLRKIIHVPAVRRKPPRPQLRVL